MNYPDKHEGNLSVSLCTRMIPTLVQSCPELNLKHYPLYSHVFCEQHIRFTISYHNSCL
jgi:hypothetical protein